MLLLLIITSNSLLIGIEESLKNPLFLNTHTKILKGELEYTHTYTHAHTPIWQTLTTAESR